MEIRRGSKRDVLRELRLSRNANLENSLKNTTGDKKILLPPEPTLYSAGNGSILAAQKSSSNLSNLELLTKVASSAQNNLHLVVENPKNVVDPLKCKEFVDTSCKPRKEKSLSILCDKFLKLYPLNLSPGNLMEISLDEATQFIGTDRRRIYDILIVLECLQMASKVCKNHYQWHGTQHLVGTLSQLKWLALRLNFFQNVNSLLMEDSSASLEECSNDIENSELNVMEPLAINAQAQRLIPCNSHIHPSTESVAATKSGELKFQKTEEDAADFELKDSSLGIMCQKFLMLFLVTSKVITLDDAAKILLGDTEGLAKDCHKVKTKVRRLYDIANVLSSLELIKKVNVSAGSSVTIGSFIRLSKKPAFQYIGPEVQPKPLPNDALANLQATRQTRHSLLGHPSHAACEKKSTRKRKPKNPCVLLPKPGNIFQETVEISGESSIGDKRSRSSALPSGERSVSGREKFPRSHSENCISETPQICGALRSDILHVAELELQRIADEEQREKANSSKNNPITQTTSKSSVTPSKCNWKHYHSENCISVSGVSEKSSVSKGSSPNVVSWKSGTLKHSGSMFNSKLAKDIKITSNVVSNVQWQSCGSTKRDVAICIINNSSRSNKLEGKFKNFNSKSTVPVLIHSMPESSRPRSISVKPVPISGLNCIVGPAYIIHQLPSDTNNSLKPVSVSMPIVKMGSSHGGLGGGTTVHNVTVE
ncbi:uncharacterized protein [Hetaerina americana]|uniref:uncharacterized protein n=1 Tax=Hetaerina americana TaxID=62018 RepID=UPI003A7F5BE7